MIRCCYGCVPPKRHTACWSTCPDYLKEKAEAAKQKEAERKRHEIDNAIYDQRKRVIRRAEKQRRRK